MNDLNGRLGNTGCRFIQIDTKEVIDLSSETESSIFLCAKKVKEDNGLSSKQHECKINSTTIYELCLHGVGEVYL